jgi:peptidoglycan-associated lipoprotein
VLALAGCCGAKVSKTKMPPVAEKVSPAPPMEEQVAPQALPNEELAALLREAQAEGALLPIYFDFDKYSLKPAAKSNLDKTAGWLSKKSTVKIRIEGNCDERGTIEYNVALGERRANGAKQYLVKLGISPDRLETVSWGKEKPICTEHNESCWAKNRRDDFNPTSK